MGGPPAPVVLAAVHFTRRQCGMAAGTSVSITRDVDVDHRGVLDHEPLRKQFHCIRGARSLWHRAGHQQVHLLGRRRVINPARGNQLDETVHQVFHPEQNPDTGLDRPDQTSMSVSRSRSRNARMGTMKGFLPAGSRSCR